MKKIGTGLRFFNCNAQQTVQCNNFDGCYHGVELNSSWIGDQGNNNNPSDNEWFNQPVGFFDAFGVLPYTPSIWFVRSVSLPYAPVWQNYFGPNPPMPVPYQVVSNPPGYNCQPPLISDDEIVERLLIVITQSDFYVDLSDDVQHRITAQAYSDLMNNPGLMNRGTSEDAILHNFVDSIAQTDIGYLFEVNNSIQNSDSATAIEYNDYVTGVNSQDENAAIVNDIYLNHFNEDEFLFDSTTIAQLEDIAFQNPIEGGTAIYGAIVLLDLNIDHETNGYSLRQLTNEVLDEIKEPFIVFPNPVQEQLTIISNKELTGNVIVEITDALGQTNFTYKLENNRGVFLINTKQLNSGVYNLSIKNDATLIFNKKIIILK